MSGIVGKVKANGASLVLGRKEVTVKRVPRLFNRSLNLSQDPDV